MKSKVYFIILFIFIVIGGITIISSCNLRDESSDITSYRNEVIVENIRTTAKTSKQRYFIKNGSQQVVASSIGFITESAAKENGEIVPLKVLYYICPCGAEGKMYPPYVLDSLY